MPFPARFSSFSNVFQAILDFFPCTRSSYSASETEEIEELEEAGHEMVTLAPDSPAVLVAQPEPVLPAKVQESYRISQMDQDLMAHYLATGTRPADKIEQPKVTVSIANLNRCVLACGRANRADDQATLRLQLVRFLLHRANQAELYDLETALREAETARDSFSIVGNVQGEALAVCFAAQAQVLLAREKALSPLSNSQEKMTSQAAYEKLQKDLPLLFRKAKLVASKVRDKMKNREVSKTLEATIAYTLSFAELATEPNSREASRHLDHAATLFAQEGLDDEVALCWILLARHRIAGRAWENASQTLRAMEATIGNLAIATQAQFYAATGELAKGTGNPGRAIDDFTRARTLARACGAQGLAANLDRELSQV